MPAFLSIERILPDRNMPVHYDVSSPSWRFYLAGKVTWKKQAGYQVKFQSISDKMFVKSQVG